MGGDEIVIAIVCAVVALVGSDRTSVARMPGLYLRDARWVGLTRLAVAAAMGWVLVVLLNYADPSVKGIYVWFYLLMGYAVVRGVGTLGLRFFGVRLRVDVCERHNPAAGIFSAGFLLATGMIFGGCLWGEADPSGGGEGGWWIPLGFFAAGWGALLLAVALFFWREPGPTVLAIRRDRKVPQARAAAMYALAAAWVLTQAVSGDFYGWKQGLLAVGSVVALLVVHEAFAFAQGRMSAMAGQVAPSRNWEGVAYAISGLLFWWLNRLLESRLAGGA